MGFQVRTCELNTYQQITLKQMRVKELVEGCNLK